MSTAVENISADGDRGHAEEHEVDQDGVVKSRDNRRRFPQRHRHRHFRKIPRALPTTQKPEGKGRRRTQSASSNTSSGGRKRLNSTRRRNASESSTASEAYNHAPMKKLREMIQEKYERKGLNMLNGYIKNKLNMAKFINNTAFLTRCRIMQVVPVCYRLNCDKIRNTRDVIRLLDRFSCQLMESDLHHNKVRKHQVGPLLIRKEQQLKEVFSDDDFVHVIDTVKEAYETKFNRIKDSQIKNINALFKEYEIVIRNKDDKALEDAEQKNDLASDEVEVLAAKAEEAKKEESGGDDVVDSNKDVSDKEEVDQKAADTDEESESDQEDAEPVTDDRDKVKVESDLRVSKPAPETHAGGDVKIIEP